MELREYERYTLRQIVLPIEYRDKLEQVKRTIRMLTGQNVSAETVIMCMIDEFTNMHGVCENDQRKEKEVVEEVANEAQEGGVYYER